MYSSVYLCIPVYIYRLYVAHMCFVSNSFHAAHSKIIGASRSDRMCEERVVVDGPEDEVTRLFSLDIFNSIFWGRSSAMSATGHNI